MHSLVEKWAIWRPTDLEPRPPLPQVSPLARRRLTLLERASLASAFSVWSPGEEIPVVFASRWGEIGVTEKLIRQFHAEGAMSPAAFSVSVHNATPGAFSIFTRNHAPYTAVSAREKTLEMGLLETLSLSQRALFMYAEESTPALYRPLLETPVETFSFAAIFRPATPADVARTRVRELADAIRALLFQHVDSADGT